MSRFNTWQSGTALFSMLALTAGAAAPLVAYAPVQAQTQFSDVSASYWAAGFIQELNQRNIIRGFPDGTFRPNDPVTRAQFAAMVRQAFSRAPMRQEARFVDVPNNYWGAAAIQDAYKTGFLSGYPGNVFRPEENIPRAQVLVSLANGLGYTASNSAGNVLQIYNDASAIPNWATNSIAAATEKKIVVNYPNVQTLNPNRAATRAEVAAFIYQAMVSMGQTAAISSPYIVGQASSPVVSQLPAGTTLTVGHQAEKILVSLEEPKPVPLTLTLNRDVMMDGKVLIPANSQVVGEIRLEGEGARFYANELLVNGSRLPLSATSAVVTKTQWVTRGANALEIIGGAALGAGAAAAITGLTGDREVELITVLGGGAAGALAGYFLGRDSVTLISINPNTDLNLTLSAPLAMR
ncbi:MAG: S-layer homology domain-containing protein [Elainella sp. C42_A2020_010]|nr:S-layer homology domain-containing protein [Elainella sp. C42_A2020_010]